MKKQYVISTDSMVIEEKKEKKHKLKKEDIKNDFQRQKTKEKKKNVRSGRLIIRNLSFKSTEDSIRELFSKFGDVEEVNLLKKGNKLVGCCFIQFKNKISAAKAIAKLSGQPFLGRPIVVDWALPKDKFTKVIKKELDPTKVNVKQEPKDLSSEEESIDEEEENIKSEDEGDATIKSEDNESEQDESDEESEQDESDESDEESEQVESDESDDESESNSKQTVTKKPQGGKNQEKGKDKKFHFQYDPQDVSDGRTVFFKNVPFSANDDDLLKCAKEMGPVVYAVVCMDPLTEHSKGTAFVKFNDKSIVEDLISGKSNLILKGVKLDAYLALKKNQLHENPDKKSPKDNRNLYLLREGVVLAGSPAAEGVSESDMSKRLQLEHWKTQTLRNLNKFVSTNRLVVHNVPPFYDDNRLHQVFKDNSPKGSIITEVRIIRNLRDIDDKGVGRSKGFGFVTFKRHEDALAALRKINNNPKIFKENKRPIVGFSIENRTALRIKEKRKAKSQNQTPKSSNDVKAEPTSKVVNNKRKFSKVEEGNVPEYCGYTAKPGVKKMRSRKELNVQAALHHKALVDKKKFQKKLRFMGRKRKGNLKK